MASLEASKLQRVYAGFDSPWVNRRVGEKQVDSPRVNQIQRTHVEAMMLPIALVVALAGGIQCIMWMHKA